MIQLKPYNSNDYSLYLPLYLSAFPEDERRAVEEWKTYLDIGKTLAFSIYEDQQFRGFITYWLFDLFTYAEHFVIDDTQRGKGIGTQAFRAFLQQLPNKPLILEVEPEYINDLAKKRIQFYNRHNLVVLPHDYVQPAYHHTLSSVRLQLMTTHPKVATPIMPQIIDTLHKEVYNQ